MSNYICGWCGKTIGPALTPEDSHGICRRCKSLVLREIPIWQRVKARARLDGWSAVFGWALVYVVLGFWAFQCLRLGGAF